MNTTSGQQDIISGDYENYKETQAEIYAMECRRVRNSMFWIAGIILAGDMLAFAIAGIFTSQLILASLVFPAIFVGIGLLGTKQPMVSAILGTLVFIGLIILLYVVSGQMDGLLGIIMKAVMIYFLFAAFQSARTAEQAKKEMQ